MDDIDMLNPQAIGDELKVVRHQMTELAKKEKELAAMMNAAYDTNPDLEVEGWKRIQMKTTELDKTISQRDMEQLVEQFGVSAVLPSKKRLRP